MAKKPVNLKNVMGNRGEKIVEICLTNYRPFQISLFRPGFFEVAVPVTAIGSSPADKRKFVKAVLSI
jgi:hypothetical protein